MRGLNISRIIWFDEVNSRLTGANARLREFDCKGLICVAVFAAKRAVSGEIAEIPGFDGKNREFGPHRETARGAAFRRHADPCRCPSTGHCIIITS
jgi:hypothetical protein